MIYYKLSITKTGKPLFSKDDYQLYDNQTEFFKTVELMQAWLAKEYFYCKKKVSMYRDTKDGQAPIVGYIYCFKGCENETCQDWIEASLIKEKGILFKK